jgi:SAM-dependent methyltransferase
MAQHSEWENEYKHSKLVTQSEEPQNDFKRFYKFLKKDEGVSFEDLHVLDLGCGTGKNSIFLAERGAVCTGLEISKTALSLARERAKANGLTTTFLEKSFGDPFPFEDLSFDLALDIMSSNSLTEEERETYLKETSRVLKPGGYFFVRLLALDGDKNAQTLLKTHPGKEPGTYCLPEVGVTERVLTKQEFIDYYSPFFTIIKLDRKSGYTHVGNRLFKRNYWIGYLKKLEDRK